MVKLEETELPAASVARAVTVLHANAGDFDIFRMAEIGAQQSRKMTHRAVFAQIPVTSRLAAAP